MPSTQLTRKAEEERSGILSAGQTGKPAETGSQSGRKVWIDLENSPHIPFFRPIIRELEAQGCTVLLTARDCFPVCELADMAGFKYRTIGRHYGKHRLAKSAGLGIRVLQLLPLIMRQRPDISVSHGSRSSGVVAALLGIPSITITDYEYADHRLFTWLGGKQWIMTPDVIPSAIFENHAISPDRVLHYPGIKEDVYTPFLQPDPAVKNLLGLQDGDVLVTIRPPATEAHYHNPESEKLLMVVFEMLSAHPEVKTVLLPRPHKQEEELRQAKPELFASGRMIVPKHAVDGLDLIWYSDLVISGGGTMNREAAALGVPVYSLFRGTMGAVDKHLAATGKLVLLQSEPDVRNQLKLVRRDRALVSRETQLATLKTVVSHITTILKKKG